MKRNLFKALILTMVMVMTGANADCQMRAKRNADTLYCVKKDTVKETGTDLTFVDKDGVKHAVYKTKNEKFYYIRTSKAGNRYKCYIAIVN